MHRGVVGEHVGQVDLRVFGVAHGLHLLAPQQPGLHDVGLVSAAHPPRSIPGQIERDPCHPADFAGGIDMGVDPAPGVPFARHAAGLAEIDAAGQLANEQDIEAGDDLGLERRRVDQRGEGPRRAQVGEYAHAGAQGQQPCLGPHGIRLPGPLRPADRAHQHRIGGLGGSKRCRRQRHPVDIDCRAAEARLGHDDIESGGGVQLLDDTRRLTRHFGADAVAGEEEQGFGHRAAAPASHGRSAASRASNEAIAGAMDSVRPISSCPVSSAALRNGSTAKAKRS